MTISATVRAVVVLTAFGLITTSCSLLRPSVDDEVTITGKLVQRTFHNDESNMNENRYILVADSPVYFPGDETTGPLEDVEEIQLMFPNDGIGDYLNKRVRVRGVLFGGDTSHNFFDVMMYVDGMEVLGE